LKFQVFKQTLEKRQKLPTLDHTNSLGFWCCVVLCRVPDRRASWVNHHGRSYEAEGDSYMKQNAQKEESEEGITGERVMMPVGVYFGF
jgi:hypothetical protein